MTTLAPVPISTTSEIAILPEEFVEFALHSTNLLDELPELSLPSVPLLRPEDLANDLYNSVIVHYISSSHSCIHLNNLRFSLYRNHFHSKLVQFITEKFTERNPSSFAQVDQIIREALNSLGFQ